MTFEEREIEETEEPEALEDDELEVDDPEEVEAELAATGDDDEDSDETSLDELLAQRAARRAPDEADDEPDTDDLIALSSEAENPIREPLPSRVIPIRDRQEFVCNRCHLVKKRSQLADADKGLCRDCV